MVEIAGIYTPIHSTSCSVYFLEKRVGSLYSVGRLPPGIDVLLRELISTLSSTHLQILVPWCVDYGCYAILDTRSQPSQAPSSPTGATISATLEHLPNDDSLFAGVPEQ